MPGWGRRIADDAIAETGVDTLQALKLGQMLATLPERLVLAPAAEHDPRRLPRSGAG
jgi:hypothetical protein